MKLFNITLFLISSIFLFSDVNAGTNITPSVPRNFELHTYEKHFELVWLLNEEEDIAGYNIYRLSNGSYSLFTSVPKEDNFRILWVGVLGNSQSFKIAAYNNSGEESDLTESRYGVTSIMTDEEFLDMVQRATFRYFWNYAHPVSGLTRERLGSNNTVTSGGSGFGVMAILVGIERGFITREEGINRIIKITKFLLNKVDRYHGAYPHWFNGSTGKTIPFSAYDDGGDIVETSFLMQGLLTVRSYFNGASSNETEIRNNITEIWEGVEWTWYMRSIYSNFLYWHWSPNYNWRMNMEVIGYNEAMITYLMAIASPSHPVPVKLFHNGWAGSSSYKNGNTYFGHKLWVGKPYGGPLFFSHYSFLGFDPRFLRDKFTNYFEQSRNHTLINRAYCIANPKGHAGYSENIWGLTASDNPFGYSAHEPYNNDNGTIAPTAAISSMPYTPTESIEALKAFYRIYGDKLWGIYGFKDAFNVSENWFASSYISIDQGPIIIMIENYRSQLLWNNFMADPEILAMIDSVGFVKDTSVSVNKNNVITIPKDFKLLGNFPNPFNPSTTLEFMLPIASQVEVEIFDILGNKIRSFLYDKLPAGINKTYWNGRDNNGKIISSGIYFYSIKSGKQILFGKMILQK